MEISKYDKRLILTKDLDGSKIVKRISPYNTSHLHNILVTTNKYIGSGRWLRNEIIKMDTTRFDVVGDVLKHNWAMRESSKDNRMHQDVAAFMAAGDSVVL